MANNIVLNPQKGDAIAITGVSSAYVQPNAFAQIGVTVYSTASIAANAGNALYGKSLTFSGFTTPGYNGTFFVLASTATTITTNNAQNATTNTPVVQAGSAAYLTQGTPAGYASKIENRWSNQNDDNTVSNANAGDLLVAIAVGMKSYQPFDLLHGSSQAPGYLQGLNDFNANPTIDDNSAATPAPVTSAQIGKNVYVATQANSVATITATGAA